jgi:hypothetical protein
VKPDVATHTHTHTHTVKAVTMLWVRNSHQNGDCWLPAIVHLRQIGKVVKQPAINLPLRSSRYEEAGHRRSTRPSCILVLTRPGIFRSTTAFQLLKFRLLRTRNKFPARTPRPSVSSIFSDARCSHCGAAAAASSSLPLISAGMCAESDDKFNCAMEG